MKKLLFAVILLLLTAAPAFAQNTSTTQMQLVNSPVFTNRLQYLMAQQAQTVLVEVQTVSGNPNANFNYTAACHTLRYGFAQAVLANPAYQASQASVLISGANFSGAVIVGTVTGSGSTADSSATDTAVATAIQNDWNTLSRCVINP